MNIESRHTVIVNTDSLRRCYNGVNAKEESLWSSWRTLELGLDEVKGEERLSFWRELNDYAVSQRGESARREFRLAEESK